MPQAKALDANGKLLRRFYEPLVLLKVMDPTRGASHPDLIVERGLSEPSILWRNFLDQLAFLCDFDTGGDTVTAVAVPRLVDHPIFYLASNSNSIAKGKACARLVWMLGLLGKMHVTEKIAAEVELEMTSKCITFSRPRIAAYTRWLISAIRKARRTMTVRSNPEDAFVDTEFRQLESLQATPHQLCLHADGLRNHRLIHVLHRRHTAHLQRGVWSDLRHYIGRLGSWSKAVRVVVRGALKFPQHIDHARVQVVGTNGPADVPITDHATDLQAVVRRMFPRDQTSVAELLHEALLEANRVADIESQFRVEYTDLKPRPLAELLLLEHFHASGLDFATEDRYIGCSKPSCYCCDLYLQHHPGGFARRPLSRKPAYQVGAPTSSPTGKFSRRPTEGKAASGTHLPDAPENAGQHPPRLAAANLVETTQESTAA